MKVRVNRHRLTVTAELAPSSSSRDDRDLKRMLAKAERMLQSLVARGVAESFWLEPDLDAASFDESRHNKHAFLGVGLPKTPGLEIAAASALDRVRGIALTLSLPPRPPYGDPRLAVAVATKVALQAEMPVDSLEIVDVAYALWLARESDEPVSLTVRFRSRRPAATALSDHVHMGTLGDDAVFVSIDKEWASSAAFSQNELDAAISGALLDETLGFSREDVKSMLSRVQRELKQTSNWTGFEYPETSIALFPRRNRSRIAASPELHVSISPDRMTCRVASPPRTAEPLVSLSEAAIRAQILRHGVSSLKEEALAEILAAQSRHEPFDVVVAEGTAAVAPRDAYPCRIRDARNGGMSPKTLARPQEKIATVAYLVPGVVGIDVTGKELPPPLPAKDDLEAGEGVFRTRDGFFAKIAGSVVIKDKTVSVTPVQAIAGSLTSLGGHLHSEESLAVAGGVEPGASLSARGKIDVGQSFAGSYLRSGGDLVVQGGMTGDRSSLAIVGGNLHVKFMQSGRVRCKGNVVVESNMTGGIIETEGDVTVLAADGGIFGGTIIAGGSVTVANVGRGSGTGPSIWFGVDARQAARKHQLQGRRQVLSALLDEVDRSGFAKEATGGERQKRTETRAVAVKRRDQLVRLLAKIDGAFAGIVLTPKEGKVLRVAGAIRQGTRVACGNATLIVKDDVAATEAKFLHGKIVLTNPSEPENKPRQ